MLICLFRFALIFYLNFCWENFKIFIMWKNESNSYDFVPDLEKILDVKNQSDNSCSINW
jgi:hypothetical protein